jgi:hypothetical protein
MRADRISKKLVCALAVLVLAAASSASAANEARDVLLRLLDQYRLPRTLHCKVVAEYDYKTIPPGLFHVEGTQEYWVDGPKYRILQLLNTAMFPGMSQDVRWDGDRFQWLNVADSTLIFSQHPMQKTPYIGVPIPLLPLEFLNSGGNDLSVKLPLDVLCSDQTRSRLSEAHLVKPGDTEVQFPGGKIGDTDFCYRIDFDGSPSYLPSAIKTLSASGVELASDEFSYQPVHCASGTLYLPQRVKMTDRTTDNRVFVVANFTVNLIEADVQIPPETFVVDFQSAKSVINLDRQERPNPLSQAGLGEARGIVIQHDTPTAARPVSLSLEPSLLRPNLTIIDKNQLPIENFVLVSCGLISFVAGCVVIVCNRLSARRR